ncbi:plant virulence effector HPE1-like domain-containing protein [Pararhizobium gei]|uniref:plant virulence effector HPE1-like domain-containing protein n=1 Tax=Pararhizobium gei TaxID=1395951 RepID=UPI0023DC88D0|nr:plant virulence effector HPE1-like domain-containing protein [Rhizobium gei]
MRILLLTLASLAAAAPAAASSIEIVASGTLGNGSIEQLSCSHCPPPVVRKKTGYVVPEVPAGTDRVEFKEINGEMKLVRTEAWLGGSPVVFISKASPEAVEAARSKAAPNTLAAGAATTTPLEAEATTTLPVIDDVATTGSLNGPSVAGMAGITPKDSHSQEVDLQSFELRLK